MLEHLLKFEFWCFFWIPLQVAYHIVPSVPRITILRKSYWNSEVIKWNINNLAPTLGNVKWLRKMGLCISVFLCISRPCNLSRGICSEQRRLCKKKSFVFLPKFGHFVFLPSLSVCSFCFQTSSIKHPWFFCLERVRFQILLQKIARLLRDFWAGFQSLCLLRRRAHLYFLCGGLLGVFTWCCLRDTQPPSVCCDQDTDRDFEPDNSLVNPLVGACAWRQCCETEPL